MTGSKENPKYSRIHRSEIFAWCANRGKIVWGWLCGSVEPLPSGTECALSISYLQLPDYKTGYKTKSKPITQKGVL